jgi:hypothetical protein
VEGFVSANLLGFFEAKWREKVWEKLSASACNWSRIEGLTRILMIFVTLVDFVIESIPPL